MLLPAIPESIERAFPKDHGNADDNSWRIGRRLEGGLTLTRLARARLLIDDLDRLTRREALRTAARRAYAVERSPCATCRRGVPVRRPRLSVRRGPQYRARAGRGPATHARTGRSARAPRPPAPQPPAPPWRTT